MYVRRSRSSCKKDVSIDCALQRSQLCHNSHYRVTTGKTATMVVFTVFCLLLTTTATTTTAFLNTIFTNSLSITSMTMAAAASSKSIKSSPRRIVVIGGGIQGISVAYHLAERKDVEHVTILEAKAPASAASGKGGGFMARSWGEGSSTQQLHELAFDMYQTMAPALGCSSYRKLPVLSVSAGYQKGIALAKKKPQLAPIMPNWLDGDEYGRISVLGMGDDTAQITPLEFVEKMLQAYPDKISVVLGTCQGVESDQGSERGNQKIFGVKYIPRGEDQEKLVPADAVVVSAGPWSCCAEDWFRGAVQLPMEGVKSTSIVWAKPETNQEVDATALFCGEDDRFGTHRKLSNPESGYNSNICNLPKFFSYWLWTWCLVEVYPRPDGTIYICGIGGSDYISTEDLKSGAFLEECNAKDTRAEAAKNSFQQMSSIYRNNGELERVQACMRPCPPGMDCFVLPAFCFVCLFFSRHFGCLFS
jgi:glycine/D-amino acid oxidase-like deaminating enzyme